MQPNVDSTGVSPKMAVMGKSQSEELPAAAGSGVKGGKRSLRSLSGMIDRFFAAPRPRQIWGPDGASVDMGCPEVGWMELFLDLVFVGYFIILGKNITHCDDFSFDSILRFWANFTLVWGTRNLMDAYLNRFSLSHDLTICAFFLFTGGLMLMILNTADGVCEINGNPLYVLQGWAAGFLMCRLTILGLLYYTYNHNRKLLGGLMFEGLMITLQCTIVILAIYHPDLIYFVAEMDIVFVPLRLVFNSAIQNIYPSWNLFPYPVNQWKMQERHAVWCVLALGEAIIQLAEVDPEEMKGNLKPMYLFTTGTAVMMFAIGGAYFETCCVHEHGTERVHALRRSKWTGAFWTIGQNVLSFCIFLVGPLTSLMLDGYISFETGSRNNPNPFSQSEREWDNHWEDEIRKKVLLTGSTCCVIHIMLILLSRVHENFIHPTAGVSEWRLDAKPWYVVVEVAFAMLHLAVGRGEIIHTDLDSWTPVLQSLIFVTPRLIVSMQQFLYVLVDVGALVSEFLSDDGGKSVDVNILRSQQSIEQDFMVRHKSQQARESARLDTEDDDISIMSIRNSDVAGGYVPYRSSISLENTAGAPTIGTELSAVIQPKGRSSLSPNEATHNPIVKDAAISTKDTTVPKTN